MYKRIKETYNSHKTISVVIPCIPKHIKHLNELLHSIESQTLLPQEVIIALSETNNQYCIKLQNEYNKLYNKLKIIFNCVEHNAYAAENRNRGARIVNTDYITFIDADDLMNPNKIMTIIKLFKTIDTDVILHTIKDKKITNKIIYSDEIRSQIDKNHTNYLQHKLFGLNNRIHHAHISIKTDVYNKYKQNEDSKYYRKEDSEFVKRLINSDVKTIIIDTDLTQYRQVLSSKKF
jgi:glycosyltransferase involved in cell wall biosynthesis